MVLKPQLFTKKGQWLNLVYDSKTHHSAQKPTTSPSAVHEANYHPLTCTTQSTENHRRTESTECTCEWYWYIRDGDNVVWFVRVVKQEDNFVNKMVNVWLVFRTSDVQHPLVSWRVVHVLLTANKEPVSDTMTVSATQWRCHIASDRLTPSSLNLLEIQLTPSWSWNCQPWSQRIVTEKPLWMDRQAEK